MSTPLPTTPRPTNTPTQQPTQQPSPTAGPVIYGDINNDNLVNSLDLTLLKRMLLGFNPPDVNLDAADLNMDGAINSMDLSILKRYLTKKIDTLPYV